MAHIQIQASIHEICISVFFSFRQQLINGEFIWEPLHQHLILGTFSWGYLFSLGTAGLLAGRSSGHKVLGYFHLSLSFCSLLTPLAAKFMHVYSVMVLQFITGFCAVSCIRRTICFLPIAAYYYRGIIIFIIIILEIIFLNH